MAKLSRGVIKSIVKECLIEILEEGLSSSSSLDEARHANPQGRPRRKKITGVKSREHVHDNNTIINSDFESNIDRVTKTMTEDPVLSSILADTAKTTLQEQVSADRSSIQGNTIASAGAGDAASQMMSNSNPEEIFSESASKWADLAFSGTGNRPQ